jgi:hypothetical protein
MYSGRNLGDGALVLTILTMHVSTGKCQDPGFLPRSIAGGVDREVRSESSAIGYGRRGKVEDADTCRQQSETAKVVTDPGMLELRGPPGDASQTGNRIYLR